MRVGVCVIDTTHKRIIPSAWNAIQFTKVVDGICGMAHQPYKFLIIFLLNYYHVSCLGTPISTEVRWYDMHAFSLSSLIASKLVQTNFICNLLFGIWAFFSHGDQYTNYSNVKDSLL